MNNMQQFTPQEAVYFYLDGELPVEWEQKLFDELAKNPELRSEMNDLLRIRSAFRSDEFLPSPRVINSLMAHVANDAAWVSKAAGVSSAIGSGGALSALFLKSSFSVRSVITGFGVSMMSFIMPAMISTHTEILPDSYSDRNTLTSEFPHNNQLNNNLSAATHNSKFENIRRPQIFAQNTETANVEGLSEDTPEIGQASTHSLTPQQFSFPRETQSSFALSQYPDFPSPTHAASTVLEPFAPLDNNDNLIVRVRGLGWNMTPNSIVRQGGSWFDNASLGISQHLGNGHLVGLEIGNEPLRIGFRGVVGGRETSYESNLSYLWVGVAYRYNAESLNIANIIYPYAEVIGGLAIPSFPIGKASVGLTYAPSKSLQFSIGIEQSVLGYRYGGQWLASDKIGVSYNVAVNLDQL